jgi:NitT/TauT family transport system substrate-binding protein
MMRALVAAAIAVGFLCGMTGAHAADKIRVSLFKIAASTNLWVAQKTGILARNGLEAELIEFRNGNDGIMGHRGGSIDFVQSIPGTAMVAVERGFDLVLLTQNETAKSAGPDAGSIQVLVDSPYQKLSDLAGKKVAVSGFHSQMTVAVQTSFEKAGVDSSKIQLIELPFSAMIDALKAKQIDAIAELDPWTTQLKISHVGRNLSWPYIESVPEQPIGAWYASSAFISRRRDVADRFVKSLHDAMDYLNADEARARRLVAEFTGLDPKLTDSMPLIKWDWHIRRDRWQATIDMMHQHGELQKPHIADEYISEVARPAVAQ